MWKPLEKDEKVLMCFCEPAAAHKKIEPWPLFRHIISARLSPNENENSPKRAGDEGRWGIFEEKRRYGRVA
jgi:hypothetical protein